MKRNYSEHRDSISTINEEKTEEEIKSKKLRKEEIIKTYCRVKPLQNIDEGGI